MLCADDRISFSELPDLLIFGDDASAATFYAASAKPRLVRDGDGPPQINLLLYGKKSGGVFSPTGGVLSATVSLGLTDQEQKRLDGLLRRRLAEAATLRVSGLPWLDGSVEFHPTPKISATQNPSMFGDNRCSFNLRLDDEQAREAEKEWEKGLRNSRVVYRIRVSAGPVATSRTEFRSAQSATIDDRSATAGATASYSQASTSQSALALDLEGPLDLSRQDAQRQITRVEI